MVTNSDSQSSNSSCNALTSLPLNSFLTSVNTVGPAPLITVAYAPCSIANALIRSKSGSNVDDKVHENHLSSSSFQLIHNYVELKH